MDAEDETYYEMGNNKIVRMSVKGSQRSNTITMQLHKLIYN